MHTPIDKEQKITVLISALEERYAAMRTIRERVQSIGIWALGLLLAAGGWIIQTAPSFTPTQKLLYVLGILAGFAALRFKYLKDLQGGFKSQQRTAARLEKTLGLYTPGVFDDQSDSIYPEKWEHAGTTKGDGKFFEATHILLYVGVVFLIIAILMAHTPHYGFFIGHRL